MDTHTQRFKVRLGLFILGGLTLFVMAIFIIGKQKNLFNPVFKLHATFYNVSGLQVGNNIRFSGINVGTVDNITIVDDSTVLVDMLIRQEIKKFIKSDSRVSVGSEGLIGDKLVVITKGSPNLPIVTENQQLESIEPVEMDAIIASLKKTVENTEVITKEAADMMLKINSGKGTLGRIVHDTIIAQKISKSIDNFENTTEELDRTMTATKYGLAEIMLSLKLTADNAKGSTQELEEIMVNLNNGEGTIGRFLQDTTTSNNIDETIINLKSSSKALDENLEALKHNIFFRGYFKKKAKEDLLKKTEAEAEAKKDSLEYWKIKPVP